jgi:uncharacterized damage-inducible protein DinB
MTIAETMLGEFDHAMATTRTVLERVPDADPAWKPHPKSYSMGDLRGFIMNHMIHHRAQLTVYLRLRDVPLPSVYGPTADLEARR